MLCKDYLKQEVKRLIAEDYLSLIPDIADYLERLLKSIRQTVKRIRVKRIEHRERNVSQLD